MKITIKTDVETLFLLHKIVGQHGWYSFPKTIAERLKKSMITEIFEILNKRCFAYSANPNGRKMSVSFRYHLASLLFDIIRITELTFGIYEANKLEIFKNELHKKLL